LCRSRSEAQGAERMSKDKVQTLHETLAGIFSGPDPIFCNTERSSSVFDPAALAGMFKELPPNCAETKTSALGLDHQALTEMFGVLPKVSTNLQRSPTTLDLASSSHISDQCDNGEQVSQALANAVSTEAESARLPRAKALLAELRSIFSNKLEPASQSVERDLSPSSPSPDLDKTGPANGPLAMGSPTVTDRERPSSAESQLREPTAQDPTNAEAPSVSSGHQLSSPSLCDQPDDVRQAVADTSPVGTKNARPPEARSSETPSLNSCNRKSLPAIFGEKSSPLTIAHWLEDDVTEVAAVISITPSEAERPVEPLLTEARSVKAPLDIAKELSQAPSGPAGDTETEGKTDGIVAKANAENALPQPSSVIAKEPSRRALSGWVNGTEPKGSQAQTSSSRFEPPPSTSTNLERSEYPNDTLHSIVSRVSDHAEPAAMIYGKQAQQANLSLAGCSTDTEPSAIDFETEPWRSIFSDQRNNTETTTGAASRNAPIPSFPGEQSVLTATNVGPPLYNRQKKETSRSALIDHRDKLEPTAEVIAALPTDATSARPRLVVPVLAKPSMAISTEVESSSIWGMAPSHQVSSVHRDDLESTARTVSVAPSTDPETVEPNAQEGGPLQSDFPSHPDPINTNSPALVLERNPSMKPYSNQPDPETPEKKAAADAIEQEQQQEESLSLPDLPSVVSIDISPSTQQLENMRSPSLYAQPNNAGSAANFLTVSSTNDTSMSFRSEGRLRNWMLTGPNSPGDEAAIFGRINNADPTVGASTTGSLSTTSSATARVRPAKSVLASLDLDTAIRLRWALRDIGARRTLIWTQKDLATLIALGLVEMREELPSLTALGVDALA
jgi:hypothetical protein